MCTCEQRSDVRVCIYKMCPADYNDVFAERVTNYDRLLHFEFRRNDRNDMRFLPPPPPPHPPRHVVAAQDVAGGDGGPRGRAASLMRALHARFHVPDVPRWPRMSPLQQCIVTVLFFMDQVRGDLAYVSSNIRRLLRDCYGISDDMLLDYWRSLQEGDHVV
jgi:hypothetical protein